MATRDRNSAVNADEDLVGNPGYLDDRLLMRIARRIGCQYYQFGVFLGLTADTIKAKKASHSDAVECSFEMLLTWRQRSGSTNSTKTFTALCDALTDLDRQDLVEYVTGEAGMNTNRTPGAAAKPAAADEVAELKKQLDAVQLKLKENAVTTRQTETLISAAKRVNEADDDDEATSERLRVLGLLKEYNDPSLYPHVSSLAFGDRTLTLKGVVKDNTDVETLEWFLTSGMANDVVQLFVGYVDTWSEVDNVNALCRGLSHGRQFEVLGLYSCHLNDRGFQALVNTLLSHCVALTWLGCYDNDLTEESLTSIQELMRKMKKLRVVVSWCHLSSSACETLSEEFGSRIDVGVQRGD